MATPCGRSEARELCRSRGQADGKPVTESNLSPRAPAHIAAVDLARWQKGEYAPGGGTRIGHYERVLPMLAEPAQ